MDSSGDEKKGAVFPRHEYEAIEKAVMESARGRWFLQEFARRNRSADTLMLLDAIGRLQAALSGAGAASPPPAAEIISLAEAIRSTRTSIAKTRNDMLPEGGAISDEPAIYARIAEQAKTTAHEIMSGSQRLQRLATEMRAANGNDEHASNVEANAHSFQTIAWSQDILSQRIAKAMGLLSHVDDRASAMAAMVKPQPIEPRHIRYFAPDESLFDPAPKRAPSSPAEPAPPSPAEALPPEPKGASVVVHRVKPSANVPSLAAEPTAAHSVETEPSADDGKKRIIIIRKPSGEPPDSPLANELPEQVA